MSLESVVAMAFFVVTASGTVLRLFGIGADKHAIGVVATVCFAHLWAAMPLEGVVKLAFIIVTASGNVVIFFGIAADELVVAIDVVATDCFAHLWAALSLKKDVIESWPFL